MPPRGRPPKKKRNISGLKNQPAVSDNQINNQTNNNTDGDREDDSDQPPKDMAGSEQEDDVTPLFPKQILWQNTVVNLKKWYSRMAGQKVYNEFSKSVASTSRISVPSVPQFVQLIIKTAALLVYLVNRMISRIRNQESRLETFIKNRGHECIFLPKFHCELNPIEMASNFSIHCIVNNIIVYFITSIGDGANTATVR